jgi:predicted ATPase/DNA-binding CsgD family transcriptional regulator
MHYPLTELVGRDAELRAVRDLLAQVRLLTITGPGGVGKTRVAAAVAAGVPGAVFVDLSPARDPQLVPATVALALAVPDGGEAPLVTRIAEHIGGRRLLLVLDNCEQVAGAAPALAQLLGAAPGLAILATSRAPLRIGGEQEFALAPLPVVRAQGLDELGVEEPFGGGGPIALAPAPRVSLAAAAASPAVQLFVQRARAVRADFALTDANAGAVAAICARLDGLPLALELAAAQLRALTPEAMLARLERRLPLLAGGPRDAPARQRTLRDAIAWSVGLLAPHERRGFVRMAAFAGGCTLEAAAAVCAEPPGNEADGLALVDALLAHSLLERRGGEDEPRFVMLETVREYAAELLAASGDERAVRRRHADYFVALAERAEPALLGREHRRWFERLGAERENYRAAITWAAGQGDGLVAARVGAALWRFWWVRGGIRQGLAWLRAGLADLEARGVVDGDPERALLYARALTAGGNLALVSSEFAVAERCHQQALALYRWLGDGFGVGRSHYNLGLVAEYQGDADQAEQHYRACMAHDRQEPFALGVGLFLRGLSATALARGEGEQAYALARQAVEVTSGRDQILPLIQSLLQIGLAALALGRAAEAEGHACEAIAILRENGGRFWLAEALMVLGSAVAHAAPARAVRAFAAAERLLAHQHAPLAPKTYAQIVPFVRVAHQRLGAAAFSAAWREGARLTFEEAVALAEGDDGACGRGPAPALPPAGGTPALAGPDELSAREREILWHLSAGLTNKEIAERLLMSVNTVHSHVKSIFSKLDVTTRAAATRIALTRGLVEP